MEAITNTEAGLFISAFISSTIAPGGSEALLAWLASEQPEHPLRLILIATIGNTLGAMTSWGLGLWISHYRRPEAVLRKVSHKTLDQMRHWGVPLLLLSWLPVIGDGLCLAAGWLRFPLGASLVAIAAGKLLRYWLVVEAVTRLH